MAIHRFLVHCRSAAAAIAVATGVAPALALPGPPTVNLTTSTVNQVPGSNFGTINGAEFLWNSQQPAGTGVFNPFLRLQNTGNRTPDEQGYNTNATQVLDNKSPVNWTHDVLISTLQKSTDGQFYEFSLDINEPGNGNSLLSLDGLRLFATDTGGQSASKTTGGNGDLQYSATGNGGTLKGNLLYDMDAGADNSVLLDAARNPPGSGVADMLFRVPIAVIDNRANAQVNDKLILWSRFGLLAQADSNPVAGADADAGFEEWAFRAKVGTPVNPPGSGVPAPGSAALAALGLLALGTRLRKRGR